MSTSRQLFETWRERDVYLESTAYHSEALVRVSQGFLFPSIISRLGVENDREMTKNKFFH